MITIIGCKLPVYDLDEIPKRCWGP